jgi:hypothetical protein
MSIEDWLEDREKVRDLDIKGLCDDPYCPECGYLFTHIMKWTARGARYVRSGLTGPDGTRPMMVMN